MTDLLMRIHATLASEGCCERYQHPGIGRMRAALLLVLGLHPMVDGRCLTCGEDYPCREVNGIAAALGVVKTQSRE